MDILYTLFLKTHMFAGLAALVVFWLPALTKKGSPVHRKAGKWFVIAMTIVAITGVPLTARFYLMGQWVGATFLAYLLVITMTAISTAWFSLKLKHDRDRYYGTPYKLLSVLNVAVGGSVLYLGLAYDVMLLTLFSFIGILAGIDGLKRARKKDELSDKWWLEEHLGGMIGAGIAAHVAFGAFGLRQILPEYGAFDGFVGMLPWILPVVIGVAASVYSTRKYAPKQKQTAA
ncbi:MAG: hypothetical protein R3270_02420 [Gammaproteobacteria bacterium]|nr:hypothetical protein [Gammaproteobacteria bacterium]